MAGMQQEAANALASMTLLAPPSPLDSPNLLWEPSRLLSHIQELAADRSTERLFWTRAHSPLYSCHDSPLSWWRHPR